MFSLRSSIAAGLVAALELFSTPDAAASDPLCDGRRNCRPLTGAEIKFAKTIFGNSIDYTAVRLLDRPSRLVSLYAAATAHGSNIHFHEHETLSDDHAKGTTLNRRMLIHELTHVWQHQKGVDVRGMGFALFLRYPMNYGKAYKYEVGKSFPKYEIEQQAKIVEHYVYARDRYNNLQIAFRESSGEERRDIKARMAKECEIMGERAIILIPYLPLAAHKCNAAPG